MTLTQLWGGLLILILAPILGAVLINPWGDPEGIRSAARYPKRQLMIELTKGVGAIVLTRFFFPMSSPWELLALLAVAMGRYWRCQEAAMVAVFGGLLLHDWQITLIVGFIGFVGLTLFRQIRFGIWELLVLITLALVVRHGGQQGYLGAAIALSGTLGWISSKSPQNQQLWSFFRPEHQFYSLDRPLTAAQAGQDAALLSQLKRLGYPVLPAFILVAGDDLKAFIEMVKPDGDRPYMVRLSSELPSKRFHIPIENLSTPQDLEAAILSAFTPEPVGKQALLIQAQPAAVWSGITYSRPPLPYSRQDPFTEVVQDLVTPLIIGDGQFRQYYGLERPSPLGAEPERKPPSDILQEVAHLSRQLEEQFGSPHALEWCFDGMQVWILRVRPVYHLHPVWTRNYIAQYFPQPLRPLSASLLERVAQTAIATMYEELWQTKEDLSLTQFVSHHQGYSYLNQTFWEQVFRREQLTLQELLTIQQGRWQSVLTHPQLFYRYLRWDLGWQRQFRYEADRYFLPFLKTVTLVSQNDLSSLGLLELEQNLEQIIDALEQVATYDLRGKMILQGRRSLLKVQSLPTIPMPQTQVLQTIAMDIRNLIRDGDRQNRASLFARLAEMPDGRNIFTQIETWLQQYGYGADYPWELAQRRWQEDAGSVRQRITDFVQQPPRKQTPHYLSFRRNRIIKTLHVQQEIEQIAQGLLAQLRWYLLAIAKIWQQQGYLEDPRDIFWLKLPEVFDLLKHPQAQGMDQVLLKAQYRRSQFKVNQENPSPTPQLIYGKLVMKEDVSSSCFLQKLQGQAASSGSVIGRIKLCPHWQQPPKLGDRDILVTPYLHENLFALLPQVKGIITTAGGMLSQGTSLARQQQIPMVINVPDAMQKLHSGQWVRLDGRFGQVELLDADTPSINAN